VARASGCPRVLRINATEELPADLSGTVGVTAGASAPDELVDAVVARLAPSKGVEEVHVTDEDEYFPPPPELRDLLRGLAAALTLGLAAPPPPPEPRAGPPTDANAAGSEALSGDRHTSAADVLARLAR
jgi:4-hydroxy-3-methylbut-2-enyl diphosphate reductase